MSNGSGPIIIHSLIDAPGSTEPERIRLREILAKYQTEHKCSRLDALFICRVAWRLVR